GLVREARGERLDAELELLEAGVLGGAAQAALGEAFDLRLFGEPRRTPEHQLLHRLAELALDGGFHRAQDEPDERLEAEAAGADRRGGEALHRQERLQ